MPVSEGRHGCAATARAFGGLGPCRGPARRQPLPEKRHGCAGALRTFGGLGPCRGPHDVNHSREAPRLRRGAANVWGLGGHLGAPGREPLQRSATAPPGRCERVGAWGPSRGPRTRTTPEKRHGSAGALRTCGGLGAISGPPDANHSREAPRLRRGAANVWGLGGHLGAPGREPLQRSATAPPGRCERVGAWGPSRGPRTRTTPEKRHGSAGALRTCGGLGAISGPPDANHSREAPRLRRGAANVWGLGGHLGAPGREPLQRSATAPPGRCERVGAWGPSRGPRTRTTPEKRHGSAGALRTCGGLGAISGPPDANHSREAPRLRRGAANVWGLGGHLGAPGREPLQRSATAPPGRCERVGAWGPSRGPRTRTTPEKRHGSAGALRTCGGLGAISGPPNANHSREAPRRRRGAANGWGLGGLSGPPDANHSREAPRRRRGAANGWGLGGHLGAPG